MTTTATVPDAASAPGVPRAQGRLRLALFSPAIEQPSETFIRAHAERLPFDVTWIRGTDWDCTDAAGHALLRWGGLRGALARRTSRDDGRERFARALAGRLRRLGIEAALAEFGTIAARVRRACEIAGVPIFVHFHGYDAYVRDVLDQHRDDYAALFAQAQGIVAVSTPMVDALRRLGAPSERLVLSPCGVDPDRFTGADPGRSAPLFVGVGRFVEKKAPYLTVLAFARVVADIPSAKLVLVGSGPLLGPTRRLAGALGIAHAVEFAGVQPPEAVSALLQRARAFVQHSLTAENGDSEGTPVAVVEAQMSGLPVVATRHAGIPEVVIDGETGYLVDEADADGMGERVLGLARDAALAARLGAAGRAHASARFTLERHLGELCGMIEAGVARHRDASGRGGVR